MKTFKQLYSDCRNKKQYVDFLNFHGSHAHDNVNESKLSKLDGANNDHLGDNLNDQQDKLHELHPLESSGRTRDAVTHYINRSTPLNKKIIKAHNDGAETPKSVGNLEVKHLDNNFQKSKKKFSSYSGTNFDVRDTKPAGKSKEGNTVYHSPAYLSASIDKNTAKNFAQKKKVNGTHHILHIHTEKNDPITVIGKHGYSNEKEVLHPRNSYYEHLGTTTDGKFTTHHMRRIDKSKIK